jgi:NADH-quinone oxidoreductase subunit N
MTDLVAASAEIFVLAMACLILIVDLFVKDPRRTATFALTILTLLGAAFLTYPAGMAQGGFVFNNMVVDDLFGDLLKLILYLAVIATLFYARDYLIEREPMARGEYYVLTLFATLGMMVMISANSFLTIYIGLELLSLSLYAMVAMNRDSVRSIEAAMKYFVLGALASGFLLYGMSMIYGATGSLELNRILEALVMKSANQTTLTFGVVFVVAGLAFKLGVVPFHMWVPDVYDGAPTPVTMFIAGAAKIAAFAILFRILVNGLITQAAPSPVLGGGGGANWQEMLVVLSVLSMAIGNLAAIAQTNIKRMLAFSAISHMGFVLLGMSVGIVGGDPRYAYFAYPASMFYIVTYVLMSIGAFGMILLMARSGFESDQIDDFRGLNKRSPWFAAMMLVLMLSMAGIPFFVGFFAKFSVLQAVVLAERYWLAVAAVMFSLIGAFYYLRVVKVMYFDEPKEGCDTPIPAPIDTRVLMSMNGLAVIGLGIFPDKLMQICAIALLSSV